MATAKKTAGKTVEATPVSEWKKINSNEPIELPTGKFMRVRRVSFQTFVKAGIIPNSLMAGVEKAVQSGKAPNPDEFDAGEDSFNEMLDLVDAAVIFCAIEPEVHEIPTKRSNKGVKEEAPELKDDELLYIDEVDDQDKLFIFGLSTGGTDDVAKFRREQANVVASV